jgi:chromosome segregation ATPase
MMFKKAVVELDQQTKGAIAAVNSLTAAGAKIQTALATAKRALADAEEELTKVRTRLADSEAAGALSDAPISQPTRKALSVARDEVEVTDARVQGLESRLSENRQAIAKARLTAEEALTGWKERQSAGLAVELREAVEVFAQKLQHVAAGADALHHRGLGLALSNASFMLPGETRNALRVDWSKDPAAAEFHAAIAELVGAVIDPVEESAA